MNGLDTSVVLRLLVGEPENLAHRANEIIEGGEENGPAACVSDLVAGEAYFVLRHHYGVPHKAAVSTIYALLSDVRIECTGIALEVFKGMRSGSAAPGLMDRLIHRDYERNSGVPMVTFDRDAAKLPGAELLRP